MRRPTLLIVQPRIPHYRVDFFRRICRRWPDTVLLQGAADPADAMGNCAVDGARLQAVLPSSRLLTYLTGGRYQPSPLALLLRLCRYRPRACIVPASLNCVASTICALIAPLFGIRVIGWGQLCRHGGGPALARLKGRWLRLFNGCLLYTDRENAALRAAGYPAGRCLALNNGLAWRPGLPVDADRVRTAGAFLYCARFEPKNRLDLLFAAYRGYQGRGGMRPLILIGAGREEERIRALDASLETGVCFRGPVHDHDLLDRIFAEAYFMVHPLAIGLSIVSAFHRGLPIITHVDPWAHPPEHWLWQEGVTGIGIKGQDDPAIIASLTDSLSLADNLPLHLYQDMRLACRRAGLQATTAGMFKRFVHALDRWLKR